LSGLLVDTHALLWWRSDYSRLSSRAYEAIADGETSLFFSAASIWEISIKQALGKLDAPENLLDTMAERGFVELPVLSRHGIVAGSLPQHHRDPFDRMIVAQAQSEKLAVVTNDDRIAAYDVPVLW
jgi:PIN domain nuclease of toxin-antitoxin system